MSAETDTFFRDYFDHSVGYHTRILQDLVAEPEPLIERAGRRFNAMGPELAYANDRDHPMARSLFSCAALLALFLEVRDAGVDEHAFGAGMLREMGRALEAARERRRSDPPQDDAAAGERIRLLEEAGSASQDSAADGAFVFDVRPDGAQPGAWAMDIRSCAICHLFGQHDAMDLVPYMCATDDLMSELGNEGLVRTGTIALGRSHCDFRYQPGRPPRYLADSYPERIRIQPQS